MFKRFIIWIIKIFNPEAVVHTHGDDPRRLKPAQWAALTWEQRRAWKRGARVRFVAPGKARPGVHRKPPES